MSDERLNGMEIDFEAANVRMGLATWNTYAGEGEADLDGAQKQMAAVLANAADRALVERWLENSHERQDPLLSRRLEIWRNCFIASAVDNAPEIYTLKNGLQHRIANFKFEHDGQSIRRSELQKILRSDDNRERRRSAWQAMAPLAAANRNDLWRLSELRNGKAQELGYRD
jgi:oligoendopeptidase F